MEDDQSEVVTITQGEKRRVKKVWLGGAPHLGGGGMKRVNTIKSLQRLALGEGGLAVKEKIGRIRFLTRKPVKKQKMRGRSVRNKNSEEKKVIRTEGRGGREASTRRRGT